MHRPLPYDLKYEKLFEKEQHKNLVREDRNDRDRTTRIHHGCGGDGVALAGTRIHAQDAWPARNVHFIVPLAPGGAIDFIARRSARC